MALDKRRIFYAFALVFLVFSILTLLFWDFVRDTVATPVYHFLWAGSLILKFIPQGAYLALLVIISSLIGLSTLMAMNTKRVERRMEGYATHTDSTRYVYWKRLWANLNISPFSTSQFTSEARRLILSILAYQEGIEPSEVETRVSDGRLPVPDSIKDLIRRTEIMGAWPATKPSQNPLYRLRQMFLREEPARDPQIDRQVAEIVGFIEQRLEIDRVGNKSIGSN